MRDKSGVNSSISEVSFHHIEFALGVVFPLVKLDLLALYRLKFTLIHSISINVSDNTRILEINNGVVDEELGSRGGMENIEVVIFDPRAIEIGSRVCACMEGDGKFRVTTFASSYKMSINPGLSEGDVTCHLILPILVEEHKWVLPCITVVVLTPPTSWMVWVVELLSELRDVGNGARSRGEGNGRVVRGKPDWFVILYIVV